MKAKGENRRTAGSIGGRTITAAQVTEAGLHRSVLQEFVKSGERYRFGRGLYVRSSAWEDDFYLLQRGAWARDLLPRYRPVSAGLFRPYPGVK